MRDAWSGNANGFNVGSAGAPTYELARGRRKGANGS
jgi:hypothetical protein